MQQLECESNSITCMSCLYVHVYGNKVIYLSIYLMYKYNMEAAGVSDSCDLPTNIILHITNMHGLTRIHSHCKVTRALSSTLCSTEVI